MNLDFFHLVFSSLLLFFPISKSWSAAAGFCCQDPRHTIGPGNQSLSLPSYWKTRAAKPGKHSLHPPQADQDTRRSEQQGATANALDWGSWEQLPEKLKFKPVWFHIKYRSTTLWPRYHCKPPHMKVTSNFSKKDKIIFRLKIVTWTSGLKDSAEHTGTHGFNFLVTNQYRSPQSTAMSLFSKSKFFLKQEYYWLCPLNSDQH